MQAVRGCDHSGCSVTKFDCTNLVNLRAPVLGDRVDAVENRGEV